MEPMIAVRNAALCYQTDQREVAALADVSFFVAEGEFVSIVGPSGCGKSTLLGAIAGLEQLTSGTIELRGQPLRGTDRRLGLMPQRDGLFEWRSIWENVILGLQLRGLDDESHRAAVGRLLERYGLSGFAGSRPSQLSGGMRQRCALIRTLATEPDILLLDEPFSALDYQTRLRVSSDIFSIIRAEGKTALLVTHDISEAISLSDRVVVLSPRPARVRRVLTTGALRALGPMQRRESPAFSALFDEIWKELDIRGE